MKKSRWFSPYSAPSKTNLQPAKKRSGVYLIRKRDDTTKALKILYVGMSQTDLYKTITRHFQKWDDPQQVRVTYPQSADMLIRVIFCTPKQAVKLEEALREHYEPRDNPKPLPKDWLPKAEHYANYEAYLDADLLTKEDVAYYCPF